jgi:hypothetical protein
MSPAGSGRQTKVERVIDAYDLPAWSNRLEAEWLGDATDRTSLRDLAADLNHAIIRAALEDAQGSVVAGDVESAYQALAGDVAESERVRKRRALERDGLDVERLERDLVSHQAVHTYLTQVRDAEFERTDEDRVARKSETIQRLAGRTRAVTDSTLAELAAADELRDRDYDVVVDLRIVCNDCGRDYGVDALLEAGGCDCDRSASSGPASPE